MIIALIIAKIVGFVFGEITIVNKLRKKRVTFGLSTFVKNPIFTAESLEMSSFFSCLLISIFEDFDRQDLMPIYIKYPAPKSLMKLKRMMDLEIINATPARE